MRPQPIRKRRMIEIYFVLYLAALILLLPGKDEKLEDVSFSNIRDSQLPYSLQPEKTTLNCRLAYSPEGIRIVSIDSSNTVFFKGSVKDVRFEFVIEDESLRQKLFLKSDSLTYSRNFRIQENTEERAASFFWMPTLTERTNKTYLVHVFAEGSPEDGKSVQVKLKTQFSLNIVFIDRYADFAGSVDSISNEAVPPGNFNITQQTQGLPALTDIFLEPVERTVRTIAFEHWSNTVNVFGLNPKTDLKREPIIRIVHQPENNGGSAYIAGYSTNMFEIKGEAPQFGTLKVQLVITRKWDEQQAITEFAIQPQPVKPPNYPVIMYPGIKYTINPNLPIISGQRTKALLKEGNSLRAESRQGEEFSFTPAISDTGKILYLELYVNENLFGQKYVIRVINYQDPEIIRMNNVESGVVHLQTRSYGEHNGKENFVAKLEIEGNAVYRELIGKSSVESEKKVFLQTFRVSRKFADKPFEFKVRAVDQRGRKSWSKTYPED